jgi:hypothetical protein
MPLKAGFNPQVRTGHTGTCYCKSFVHTAAGNRPKREFNIITITSVLPANCRERKYRYLLGHTRTLYRYIFQCSITARVTQVHLSDIIFRILENLTKTDTNVNIPNFI